MGVGDGLKTFLTIYETNVTTKIKAPELRMLHLIAVATILVYWTIRLLTLHELFVIENVAGSYTVWLTEPNYAANASFCDQLRGGVDFESVTTLAACLQPGDLDEESVEACEALASFGAPFIADGEACEEFDGLLHARTSHDELFLITNIGTVNFTCQEEFEDSCVRAAPNANYPNLRSPALDPTTEWKLVAGAEQARINLHYDMRSFSIDNGFLSDVEPHFELANGTLLEWQEFADETTQRIFTRFGVVSLTVEDCLFLANVSLDDAFMNTTMGHVPHRQVGANLVIDVHGTNMLLWELGENKRVTIRVTQHELQAGFRHPDVRWDDVNMRSGEISMTYGMRFQASIDGDFFIFDPGFRVLVCVMVTDVMLQLATTIVDIIASVLCGSVFRKKFLALKHFKAPTYAELRITPIEELQTKMANRQVNPVHSPDCEAGSGGRSRGRARSESKEEPQSVAVALASSAAASASAATGRVNLLERKMLALQNAMKSAFDRIEVGMASFNGRKASPSPRLPRASSATFVAGRSPSGSPRLVRPALPRSHVSSPNVMRSSPRESALTSAAQSDAESVGANVGGGYSSAASTPMATPTSTPNISPSKTASGDRRIRRIPRDKKRIPRDSQSKHAVL